QTTTIKGKRWYVTPSGTYPSVTTVLSYHEKSWIEEWKQRVGPEKAQKETDLASERGTAIHRMCELYLQNHHTDDIMKGQPREYVKSFNQIKMALSQRINNIRAQEI